MAKHSMSNFKARSLALFCALALGASLAAQAQPSKSPCELLTESNVNEAIDPVEPLVSATPAGPSRAAFSRADTNRDGKLSRKEAEHFPAMVPHFNLIDTNGDQFLSPGELSRGAAEKT